MGSKKSISSEQRKVKNQGLDLKDKNKHFSRQFKTIDKAFRKRPGTALEVSLRTGISFPYINMHIESLRKENKIFILNSGICSVSEERTSIYTTDYNLFLKGGQRNG